MNEECVAIRECPAVLETFPVTIFRIFNRNTCLVKDDVLIKLPLDRRGKLTLKAMEEKVDEESCLA